MKSNDNAKLLALLSNRQVKGDYDSIVFGNPFAVTVAIYSEGEVGVVICAALSSCKIGF
jgi:hypothetical protein